MTWYRKVADIDLKAETLQKISDAYKPCEDIALHFSPPKLPDPVWRNMKNTPGQQHHHRALFRTQQCLFSALKPLLSLLEVSQAKSEAQGKLTTAIQLICSSNLQLNRYRRALAGSSTKK